ncbi:hypothetical protein Hanom_Chr15g01339041 [Helianthus anomalus]
MEKSLQAGFFPPIYFHQFSLTPKYCLQYCYCRSPPKSPPIRDASPKSPPHTPTGTRRTPPSTLRAPDAPHLQPPSSSATPKPPQLVFITNDPPTSKIGINIPNFFVISVDCVRVQVWVGLGSSGCCRLRVRVGYSACCGWVFRLLRVQVKVGLQFLDVVVGCRSGCGLGLGFQIVVVGFRIVLGGFSYCCGSGCGLGCETWKRSHGPKLEPDMLWNRPVFLPSWTKSLLIYGQTGQLWSNSATGYVMFISLHINVDSIYVSGF